MSYRRGSFFRLKSVNDRRIQGAMAEGSVRARYTTEIKFELVGRIDVAALKRRGKITPRLVREVFGGEQEADRTNE